MEVFAMIFEIIAIFVLLAVVGFCNLKSDMVINIEKYIAEAESMNASGAEKMTYVVDMVYGKLMPIAKAYFTADRIQRIAQAVFDRVRAYADKYIKNKVD